MLQRLDRNAIENAQWTPHPMFKGVEVCYLVTKKTNGLDITMALVRLPVGSLPERHIHENSDDIIYVLEGRGSMWVDGQGDIPLQKGDFLRIPKGVEHQPRNIEQDLLLYNVWFPSLA